MSTKRSRGKGYSNNEKLEAMRLLLNTYNNNAAEMARNTTYSVTNIKNWRKAGVDDPVTYWTQICSDSKMKTKKTTAQKFRKAGKFKEMEDKLFEMFLEQERYGLIRDDEWLCKTAVHILRETNPEQFSFKRELVAGVEVEREVCAFKFSRTWVRKFKKRRKIGRRRVINKKLCFTDFLPLFIKWIFQFRMFLLNLTRVGTPVSRAQMYNVDEVPMFLPNFLARQNSSGLSPNELKGVKYSVDVEKWWCSLVITIRADNYEDAVDGYRLKRINLIVIFRGTGKNMKKEIKYYKEKFPNVTVLWQPKAWFDTTIQKPYSEVLASRTRLNVPHVLFVDNLHAHIDEGFVELMLSKCNTYVKSLIPNGTRFMQPVDRHVGHDIKRRMKRLFEEDFAALQEKYISTGEVQKLSISDLRKRTVKFLDIAFKETCSQPNLITRRFSASGLSLPVDGSRDSEIKFAGVTHERFDFNTEKTLQSYIGNAQ